MNWLNRIKKFQLYQNGGFKLSIKTLKVSTMGVALIKKLFFIATMVLYIYIAIGLYIHIGIMFFVYCVVCLLLYCMLTAWEYCFLYIYILFLSLTSTSIFYDSGCRLSIIWLFTVQRYGGSVRYQTPGNALFG